MEHQSIKDLREIRQMCVAEAVRLKQIPYPNEYKTRSVIEIARELEGYILEKS